MRERPYRDPPFVAAPPPPPVRRPQPSRGVTTPLPPGKLRVWEPVDLEPRWTACCAVCAATAVVTSSRRYIELTAAGWRVKGTRALCARCSAKRMADRGRPSR